MSRRADTAPGGLDVLWAALLWLAAGLPAAFAVGQAAGSRWAGVALLCPLPIAAFGTIAARHGRQAAADLLGPLPDVRQVGHAFRTGVAAFVGCTFVAAAAFGLLGLLLSRDPVEPDGGGLRELVAGHGPDTIALILTVVVLVPIGEEALFRGLVRRWADRRWGRRAGIGLSAIVFAVAHLTPQAMLVTGMLGVVLARLSDRTNGIVAPILAHATFNAIVVLILRITPETTAA